MGALAADVDGVDADCVCKGADAVAVAVDGSANPPPLDPFAPL